MNPNCLKIKNSDQRGQALLFVVVALTIALSVGVAVATRNLSMTSRTTRTDTSTRVFAAAEGGMERLLSLSIANQSALASATPNCAGMGLLTPISPCASGCMISFPPTASDAVTTNACLTSTPYRYNKNELCVSTNPDEYCFVLDPGKVKEVVLRATYVSPIQQFPRTQDLRVCWNNEDTAIYYIVYDDAGNLQKGGFLSNTFSPASPVETSGFNTVNTGTNGYQRCGVIDMTVTGNPYGLRLHALYGSSKVGVFPIKVASPNNQDLPVQGYRLSSEGFLTEEGTTKTLKSIVVYKSAPYLPGVFDYSIYTEANLQ